MGRLLKKVAAKQFERGNMKMAAKMYTDAIRISPSMHTLYSNRSAALCAGGNYVEAFEDACKCVDLMPAWPKVRSVCDIAMHTCPFQAGPTHHLALAVALHVWPP